jgi:hypothetical protein
MQSANGERADDPLKRFREGWRLKARSARDTWFPGTGAVEAVLESAFHEGVAFAAEFLAKDGHPELAGKLRARVQRKA